MKKSIFLHAFLLICCALFSQKSLNYKSNEILIQFQPDIKAEAFLSEFSKDHPALPSLNIKRNTFPSLNIYTLKYDNPSFSEEEMISTLEEYPAIKAIQLNYAVDFRDSIPDDPLFETQWALDRIRAKDVWSITTGGQTSQGDEIVIAIIDKGFDIEHEDLVDNVWINMAEIPGNEIDDDQNNLVDDVYGWNFRDDSPNHQLQDHGSSVAGIAGAKGNNGVGMTGVGWNVKLMYLSSRFVDEIVASYNYVFDQRVKYNESNGEQGAFVVATNASFGLDNIFCEEQPVWGAVYDPMGEAGILGIAATTNSNRDVDEQGDMPTTCTSDYLIAVANTDREEVLDGGFGLTHIDLSAPGTGTIGPIPGSNYDLSFGGTSAACPHVAGSVGVLYSLPCESFSELSKTEPGNTALLVKEAILNGVDKIASLEGKTVTGGRLNLFKSMSYIHSYCIAEAGERDDDSFFETYIGQPDCVNIYPNPAGNLSNSVNVDFLTEDFQPVAFEVYNTLGQLIFEDKLEATPFNQQTYQLNIGNWADGTYFFSLTGIDRKITKKFIK